MQEDEPIDLRRGFPETTPTVTRFHLEMSGDRDSLIYVVQSVFGSGLDDNGYVRNDDMTLFFGAMSARERDYLRSSRGIDIEWHIELDVWSVEQAEVDRATPLVRGLLLAAHGDLLVCHEDGDVFFVRREGLLTVRRLRDAHKHGWLDYDAIFEGMAIEYATHIDS